MVRTSSIPPNSAASSNHRKPNAPRASFSDLLLPASSAPRNSTRWPVLRRISSGGSRRVSNSAAIPIRSTAHSSCSNTELRSVPATRRYTMALASGWRSRCKSSSIAAKLDFAEPRPPLRKYSSCRPARMSACTP